MPEFVLPVTTEAAKTEFAALDSFTQAYIEALCWTECNSDSEEGLDGFGFAELTVESVASAKADCARFQLENASALAIAYTGSTRRGAYDESSAGHDFWLTRNGHGAGFWDRDLPGTAGDDLSEAARRFGEVYIFREDFIPAEDVTMSPRDAWAYAATWGSFVRSGDPGACMYGFDESCLSQSEEHRRDVLAWVADCRAQVQAAPGDYDEGELGQLDSFVRYIEQAPLAANSH